MMRETGSLFLFAFGVWLVTNTALGLAPSRTSFLHQRQRDSRYFSQELLAPPLPYLNDGHLSRNRQRLSVLYTNDPMKLSKWLGDHVPNQGCTLGFDVESVPDSLYRRAIFRGPATVQFATPTASVVFQFVRSNGRASGACAPLLEAVLRDDTIVKAGVSVDDDMLELRAKFPRIEAKSRLELGGIQVRTDGQQAGLQTLCRQIVGVELPKPKSTARSNWSVVPLSQRQVLYAARDAWAGAAVVASLEAADPTTFSSESLRYRLRDQRSLKDLRKRQKRRKWAKRQLKYAKRRPRAIHETSTIVDFELSRNKYVQVLQTILDDNRFEGNEAFDIASMGFDTV